MSAIESVTPLFVPAHRPDRFDKAARSGADSVILDLEDAVPAELKDMARSNLVGNLSVPVMIRVNAINTKWHPADIARVAELKIAAVMVPKCEDPEQVAKVFSNISGRHPIVALIETAAGLANARSIAKLGCVERLAFGSIDFSADLGCSHTRDALLSARCELILASRLAGKQAPLDGVTTTIDDHELVASDAYHAREIGFGGKLCIHPNQIAAVRIGLKPQENEINWAKKTLAAAAGATLVDGAMIDAPVKARATAILARADNLNRRP